MDVPSHFVDLLYQGWTKDSIGNIFIIYRSINQASFFAWGKVFEQSFLVQCVTFWEVRLDQKAYYGQSVDSLEPCSIQFFVPALHRVLGFFNAKPFPH